MYFSDTNTEKSVQNVWEVYIVVHGTILVPSGLE